jgi:two-component sensor histidine kinase
MNQPADAQQVDPGPTNIHRSCAMLQTEGFNRQAVWAEEAMHRAASLQHLAIDLERLLDSGSIDWNNRLRTIRRAKALVAAYQNLDLSRDSGPRSCAQDLSDIAGGLVQIFGHTVGAFVLSLEIQPLLLAGEVRRALVLAASELVVNALRHAFVGRQTGIVQIRLCHDRMHHKGVLLVADDGVGPDDLPAGRDLGRVIVRDLADVLEGDVIWRQSLSLGGTEAMLRFPVPICEFE